MPGDRGTVPGAAPVTRHPFDVYANPLTSDLLSLLISGAFLLPRQGAPKEPRERHLANLRQLTNEGENAEAYFSADGKR